MTYSRAFALRWSRRDWLAVLVIAVTVAFFTGIALLVVAMGAQTAAIAADQGAVGAATYHEHTAVEVPAGAIEIPVARANGPDGPAYVAGVPADDGRTRFAERRLAPGEGTTLGTAAEAQTHELVGREGTRELSVGPRGTSFVPPTWYVTDPTTVEELGRTGTLVVDPGGEGAVPIRGVLSFFRKGTEQALDAIVAATIGGIVLLAVTVFSVTRMVVRDRRSAIRVARATGATPRRIGTLFVTRAVLLSGVGVLLGAALGVILTNAAVNAAVVIGVPTTVSIDPGAALHVLGPLLAGMVFVGGLAGALAVRGAATRPPATIGRERRAGKNGGLAPRLLAGRSVVPVAATLAVFVAFAALLAGLGLAVAPLATADEATITEPGSPHLAASDVPAGYADALRTEGVDASAEILLFTVTEDQPVVARGADFEAFATVSDAELEDGRTPGSADEAVIGAGLARTLDVEVGDAVLLGGGTAPAVARVEVVGLYDAPGAVADQIIVPLRTARHLEGMGEDRAQFIRTRGLAADAGSDGAVENAASDAGGPESAEESGVVDLETPATVPAGEAFEVTVTFRNDALTEETMSAEVRADDRIRVTETTVGGESEGRAGVTFEAGDPGTVRVVAGNVERTVRVVDSDALVVETLPDRGPPGSAPLVRVLDGSGSPVEGAAIAVDGEGVTDDGNPRRTDAGGTARVPLGAAGTRTVTVTRETRTASRTVTVSPAATRGLDPALAVTPASPTPTTEPTVEVALVNPWSDPIERTYVVEAPGGPYEQTATVPPGEQRTVAIELPRRSGGTYDVRVRTTRDSEPLAETTYRVEGDDRIASALATAGYRREAPLSQAAEVAFGNLRLLFGTMSLLAGGMVVGGTTAALASAVQARRTTIGVYRATGASRRRVLRLVLEDTCRIGAAALAVALIAGLSGLILLDVAGFLSAYGADVPPVPPAAVLGSIVAGASIILLSSAAIATVAMLKDAPAELLGGRTRGGNDE